MYLSRMIRDKKIRNIMHKVKKNKGFRKIVLGD